MSSLNFMLLCFLCCDIAQEDKSGNLLHSSLTPELHHPLGQDENQMLMHQNAQLKKKCESLQNDYIEFVNDCEAAHKRSTGNKNLIENCP